MGCLFKSFGLLLILAIILPVLLLGSLLGRFRFHTKSHQEDNHTDTPHQPHTEEDLPDNSDKPIDSSTIEYVEFEEIKDHENNIS